MATLTLTNLEDDVLRRLQARAERHGWSREEEAMSILRSALPIANRAEGEWIGSPEYLRRKEAMDELAEIRRQTSGRGSQNSVELLREPRAMRMRQLLGDDWEG